MSWKKVKRLFVVSEDDQGAAATPSDLSAVEAQVDADLAALELPAGQVGTLPAGTDPAALKGSIDFQGLYDQAGIPNTDEVEQLEKFLEGLDNSLPQASRLAAAKAFLKNQGVISSNSRKL